MNTKEPNDRPETGSQRGRGSRGTRGGRGGVQVQQIEVRKFLIQQERQLDPQDIGPRGGRRGGRYRQQQQLQQQPQYQQQQPIGPPNPFRLQVEQPQVAPPARANFGNRLLQGAANLFKKKSNRAAAEPDGDHNSDDDNSGGSSHGSDSEGIMTEADAIKKAHADEQKRTLKQDAEEQEKQRQMLLEEKKFKNPHLKLKATADYDFQREITTQSMTKYSLMDSLFFILSRCYEAHHVFSDIDVLDILKSSPAGKFMLKLIPQEEGKPSEDLYPKSVSPIIPHLTAVEQSGFLKEMLASIAWSFRTSYLESIKPTMQDEKTSTMSELVEELLDGAARSKNAVKNNSLTMLLLRLVSVDMFGEPEVETKVLDRLSAARGQISSVYGSQNFNTAFAHHLVRATMGDLSESASVDSVSQAILVKFQQLLLKSTKDISPKDYAKVIGESEYFADTNTKFTRYDLTHMLGIGLLEIGIETVTNTARRTLIFKLPDGSMYWIDNQPVLCGVEVTSSKPQNIDYFPYPKVKDNVRKLEQKEQFALSDFDWMMVVYDLDLKLYRWYSAQESITIDYSAWSRKWLHFGFSERISSFKSCIKVLIRASTLHRDGYSLPDEDKYYDFFVSEDQNATIADLIAFLNPRLQRNHIFLKNGLNLGDITFVDTRSIIKEIGTKGRKPIFAKYHNMKVPQNSQERIIDILQKNLGITNVNNQEQYLHYECLIHSSKIRSAIIEKSNYSEANKTKAEAIKLKAADNSEMIKPSTSRFINFVYQLNLAERHFDLGTQTFFAKRNIVFWLPLYLIVDVSKIGSTLMNPKTDLVLKCISNTLLERNGLFLNHRYNLVGLICSRKHSDTEFYPLEVDSVSGMSVGYLNRTLSVPTNRINDGLVKYAIFERGEYEVDDPANEFVQE